MNRIDKLVNKAFPDELRNVEPTPVDESAILSRTLEKLGLEQPAEPQPVKKTVHTPHGTGPRPETEREEHFVEVPLEIVKPHWVNRIMLGLAACLLLAFVVNWGPWLLNNLGFGSRTRPLAPGEENPGASFPITIHPIATPAPDEGESQAEPADDSAPANTILKGQAGNIRVTNFSSGGAGLQVYMRFENENSAGAFCYTITAKCGEKELYCISRSSGDATGLVSLNFASEEAFNDMEDSTITLVATLVPGLLSNSFTLEEPLTVAAFYLDPRTETVTEFTTKDYLALGYTEDQRTWPEKSED